MAEIESGLDHNDDDGQRWIAENMQGLYQELGLDPIVANLDLDRVNPHLRQLAKATQASAVSSLMELGGCVRMDTNGAGSPSKRPRGANGFHVPEAIESANKARRETPVRKRIAVDGSPTSKKGIADFDSPTCHDVGLGTPGHAVAWTPRQSPRSRHDDESLHAVAALLATPMKSCDRNGKAARKRNGKHSPASDDEAAHSPPPAAGNGAASGKAARPNGSAVLTTPSSSSLLLNDKDKKNQGLRQFSLRVCRQVEAKMTTTYNEVADELVKEFKDEEGDSDEKNIRRRAYDALNVLTAMDIIAKDKKDIQWKGFPPMVGEGGERASGASAGRDKEKARLKSKIDQKSKDLKDKEHQLKELVNQFVSLKQLLVRNAKPEYSDTADQLHRIYLPFVIVNTDADNTIECDISPDKRSAEFNCTKPFKLYDDRETLSLMRMGQIDQESIAKMLPDPGLVDFLRQIRHKQSVYTAVGTIVSDPNYDEEDMDDDDQ